MTTDSAIDGHNSKMNLGCNATTAVEVSTTQDQQEDMVKKNVQKDIGGDDAVADHGLDRFENFSIRQHVFSVRVKDIVKNWPFSQKYLQTCLENDRQPLLPPFESRSEILQETLNSKENLVARYDIMKINTVSSFSNKEKIEDSLDYENGIYGEGWVKKPKNCPRKKKMVPGKARHSRTSSNGKDNIVEGIVDIEEVAEVKGDPIKEKEISRQNDDKCQVTERDIMISCESQGIGYVAITDLARSSDSAFGEHGARQVSCEAINKQQNNQFILSDKYLNAKGGNEVRKKRGKKTVTSELKTQEDNKEQTLEKMKLQGENNDDFGNSVSLPDALVPNVCPVCRTFSSTSNTALNAHIDHCLSVESNAKKAGTKSTKPKVRAIKKRSLADICAVAPTCTLKDLEHDTSEEDQLAIDENQSPLDDVNWRENKKHRQHQHKAHNVYVDSKGKKLRILSNLKEQFQPKECQKKKYPKKRKRVASTTLVQCSQLESKVPDSVSSKKLKKKVHATSPSKHAQSEETVKVKPTSSSLGTACQERTSMSRSARVDTKKKKLIGLKQVAKEQESYYKNDRSLTDVLESTRKNSLEEELQVLPSKSALPLTSEMQCIHMTIPGKTSNGRRATDISENDCSPSVEVLENYNCKRKRHASILHSQIETIQRVSINELISVSPTLEEGSRSNAESVSQFPMEVLKLSQAVNNQSLRPVTEIHTCSNSFVSTSCQDSRMSFTTHGTPMIGYPENKASVDWNGTIDVSTGTPAHVPGVSIQDPSNEVKHVPALCEENLGKSSPLIFHENLNPSKTLQETVAPQRNSGTQSVSIYDEAKERVKSVCLQKQTLRQNPTGQNDMSCLNSVIDASAILSPSNRQFIPFSKDPVLSNILNATTNVSASLSYNGLIVEQPNSHGTRFTSLADNINSNNIWMTETEHSDPRSMKERPQGPAPKFTSISGSIFGDSICSSSSTFSKGLPLTSQGNLLHKRSFQSKDSQYLNHQSSFGSMKLTSVTVPQVVSASTLAKQLGEGKTAEEILHGCVMIEQNSNACNSQSNQVVSSSIHNNSTNPLEKQIGSKQNLNSSLFGMANGSYGGNQVVGVAPYACTIQKSISSNGRNFTSGSLGIAGGPYSSGLVNNQGLENINCFSEPSMFGNPTVRLMGKNLMVANKDGVQSKQLDTNPNGMEEYQNASYLRLLGFTSEENLLQDGNSQLGRSMESSITFDQNMFNTLEGVRSQESRLLWNRNGCSQQPTSALGDLSEWFQKLAGSNSQSSVDVTLTSAGPAWSHPDLPSSNMKFPSLHVPMTPVENRTSNRPLHANYQAKRKPLSAVHSQSDHAVIVIDDSPDINTVPNLSGLEPTSFSGWPGNFQEANSADTISIYDSMFRSGKTWPHASCTPIHFLNCKESTIASGLNLQRAKEVQEELRRLGITNPGKYVQPSYAVHSQSEPEVIIIDDTPDEEVAPNLPVLEPVSFNAQPRQFQEAHYNSMFRSGNIWGQVSSVPSHFSACKESTLSCGLNHQRAKEVQAELRRLGITNPGIAQSSSAYLKPMRGG